TVALSSFGYCRTFRLRTAWRPAMMMMRLTTIARTGRRTKMSVSFIRPSAILGLRSELGVERDVVVHDDARAVTELEGPCDDDLVALLDAALDGDEVAPVLGDPDELLPRRPHGLAIGAGRRVRRVFQDENRIAVRRVDDRRCGDRQHGLLLREDDGD